MSSCRDVVKHTQDVKTWMGWPRDRLQESLDRLTKCMHGIKQDNMTSKDTLGLCFSQVLVQSWELCRYCNYTLFTSFSYIGLFGTGFKLVSSSFARSQVGPCVEWESIRDPKTSETPPARMSGTNFRLRPKEPLQGGAAGGWVKKKNKSATGFVGWGQNHRNMERLVKTCSIYHDTMAGRARRDEHMPALFSQSVLVLKKQLDTTLPLPHFSHGRLPCRSGPDRSCRMPGWHMVVLGR